VERLATSLHHNVLMGTGTYIPCSASNCSTI